MATTVYALLVLQLTALSMVDAQDRVARASVGTFNAYLFRGAPAFQERKERLLTILQTPQENRVPDILCLQEIYRLSDALEVVEAAREHYPYQASFASLTDGSTLYESEEYACSFEEAQQIAECAMVNCFHLVGTAAFNNCTLVACQDIIFSLSTPCRVCSGTETGVEAESDPFTRCASEIPASEYAAPYGLLLLSRYELTDVTAVDYLPGEPVVLPRAYITVYVESLQETILCTHLTSKTESLDYVGPPQYATASEQQADEIKAIHSFVEGKSKIILLGDFNHGPATPGVSWNLPLNYGLMLARGLMDVNALWCGQCTFCSEDENIFTGIAESYVVDHIYLPTCRISSVVRFERLFHTILTPSGFPLSDHYGVRADLSYPSCDVSTTGMEFQPTGDIDFHIDQFCPGQILDDSME